MKNYPVLYLLPLLILQLCWNSTNATTIICGTIKDIDRTHEIEVSNTIDHFFDHGAAQAFTLDGSGYFKFELDIRHPKFVLLMYKNGIKRIFVHPNLDKPEKWQISKNKGPNKLQLTKSRIQNPLFKQKDFFLD